MAEDLQNSMSYASSKAEDKTKPDIVIYGRGGKQYSVDQFDAALAEYEKTGSTPAGFDALKPGSLPATIRGVFEAVNAPLQSAAQASDTRIANLVNRGNAYSPLNELLANNPPPNASEGALALLKKLGQFGSAGVRQLGARIGADYIQQLGPGGIPGQPVDPQASGPLHNVTRNVDTPGKLAGQGALALSGMRPIGKLLQQTSGIIPTGIRAIGTALAEYGGDKAGGIGQTESSDNPFFQKSYVRPLFTAINIAAQEGIFGLYNKVTGNSLSQKAVQQVNDDVRQEVKKSFPGVDVSNPREMEAVLSTPRGLDIFIQKGIKGFKHEVEDAGRQFTDDINEAFSLNRIKNAGAPTTQYSPIGQPIRTGQDGAPILDTMKADTTFVQRNSQQQMGKIAGKHIDKLIDDHRNAMNTMLDNLGDQEIVKAQGAIIDRTKKALINEASKEFNRLIGPSNRPEIIELKQQQLERLNVIFKQAEARERVFMEGAKVLEMMKDSNPGGGADIVKMQEYFAKRMYTGQQSQTGIPPLLERVGLALGRGQSGGIDTHRAIPSNILPSWIRNPAAIGGGLPTSSTYTGTVRGLTNPVGFEMGLKAAVDRFMSSDRETQ